MAVTMAFKNVWTQNINYPYIHIFAALSQFGGNLGQRLSPTIVPPLPKLVSWDFNVHTLERRQQRRRFTFWGFFFLLRTQILDIIVRHSRVGWVRVDFGPM
jgi:hypothetical protein